MEQNPKWLPTRTLIVGKERKHSVKKGKGGQHKEQKNTGKKIQRQQIKKRNSNTDGEQGGMSRAWKPLPSAAHEDHDYYSVL